jgi:hypothetical protein
MANTTSDSSLSINTEEESEKGSTPNWMDLYGPTTHPKKRKRCVSFASPTTSNIQYIAKRGKRKSDDDYHTPFVARPSPYYYHQPQDFSNPYYSCYYRRYRPHPTPYTDICSNETTNHASSEILRTQTEYSYSSTAEKEKASRCMANINNQESSPSPPYYYHHPSSTPYYTAFCPIRPIHPYPFNNNPSAHCIPPSPPGNDKSITPPPSIAKNTATASMSSSSSRRYGKWTTDEDAAVTTAVKRMSSRICWRTLAKELQPFGRSSKQIRERWVNYLNPLLLQTTFDKADDACLWKAHQQLGSQWKKIAIDYFLSSRSENSIKNRFKSLPFQHYVTEEFGPGAYQTAVQRHCKLCN